MRIFLAGSSGAELSDVTLEVLYADGRVELVGIALDRVDPRELRLARPDLLISAAHRYLIRRPELEVPRLGAVGLHPGMLPQYRGSYPLWWALRNGESEVGLTLYRLGQGIDDGPVLRQSTVQVYSNDTFRSLYDRVVNDVPAHLAWLIETVERLDAIPPGHQQNERLATHFQAPSRPVRAVYRARWAARARLNRNAGRL